MQSCLGKAVDSKDLMSLFNSDVDKFFQNFNNILNKEFEFDGVNKRLE